MLCVGQHFGGFWLFALVVFVYLDYLLFIGGFGAGVAGDDRCVNSVDF